MATSDIQVQVRMVILDKLPRGRIRTSYRIAYTVRKVMEIPCQDNPCLRVGNLMAASPDRYMLGFNPSS